MKDQELIHKIDELRSLGHETEWLEFKTNYCEPTEIGEYISALANAACLHDQEYGWLIFGIEDSTHRVVGTSFIPAQKKVGNQELESWLAVLLSPRIDFKIFECIYMNHPLVVFRIDASHHSPVHFKGCAYIRIGTSKTNLHGHLEKERKIWLKTREFKFEKGLTDKNLSAIEVLHLLDYPTYYRLLELPVPKGQETILEKFIEEKLIQRSESGYAITNLGAILFATSLKSFDSLSRKAIRLVLYKGKSRLETIKEQQGDRGYAVGIEGLIQFITDILPSNEEIGKVFRKKVSLYPPIAIRELVVNALIHQDFSIRGTGPLIEIFDDRIEISNPGKPLIDTLRFIDHAPQSRNESLASFMRRINLCEERGSGIDKVVSSCEIYQLPAPNFIAEELFTKVILYAPKTLREMDKLDKIRACYQHCVLKYVANDFMTNKTLRERLNVDENNYPMVSRIIADTANSGLIKDYDPNNRSKKYSKYVPFWV